MSRGRHAFNVIFHATCVPERDARDFARHVMTWWKPGVDAVERAVLEQRWTESLQPMFRQCQRDGTDMEIRVSMRGPDPAIAIQRIFKPDHHPIPKKPT